MTTAGDVPGQQARAYAGLAFGVGAVSSAAVLICLAEAPALAVSAYRVGIASLVVLPLAAALARRQLRGMGAREWGLALASAAFLALHFGFWIASLSYTSVASSVVIVTSNPILVALASHFLLRERVPRRVVLGIGLAVVGSVIIGWGDLRLGLRELYGDALALLGAVAIAGYYLVGGRLRPRLPVLAYIAPVYAAATVLLALAALGSGTPLWGFSSKSYIFLALLGLVPQLLGHSTLNWALGHLSATVVAAAVMAEPVVATALAWAVLGEPPPVATLAGGPLILAGVFMALRQ